MLKYDRVKRNVADREKDFFFIKGKSGACRVDAWPISHLNSNPFDNSDNGAIREKG